MVSYTTFYQGYFDCIFYLLIVKFHTFLVLLNGLIFYYISYCCHDFFLVAILIMKFPKFCVCFNPAFLIISILLNMQICKMRFLGTRLLHYSKNAYSYLSIDY